MTEDEKAVRKAYEPIPVRATESANRTWVIWLEDREFTFLAEKHSYSAAWKEAAKRIKQAEQERIER